LSDYWQNKRKRIEHNQRRAGRIGYTRLSILAYDLGFYTSRKNRWHKMTKEEFTARLKEDLKNA
jgi:hypothetical protein